MNKWCGTGRLTRDPEVRYSTGENSIAVARWTLAVDRDFKKQGEEQTADFISHIAFGKQAEFIEKYFKQGMKMEVVGHIQTGSYTNKDGVKVYTTEIVVETAKFAESKGSGSGQATGSQEGFHKEFRPEPSSASGDGFMNIPDGIDEELPFN